MIEDLGVGAEGERLRAYVSGPTFQGLRFRGSGSMAQGAGIGGLPAPARPTGSGTVDRAAGDRRPEP